jgi:hypothetical protein
MQQSADAILVDDASRANSVSRHEGFGTDDSVGGEVLAESNSGR